MVRNTLERFNTPVGGSSEARELFLQFEETFFKEPFLGSNQNISLVLVKTNLIRSQQTKTKLE